MGVGKEGGEERKGRGGEERRGQLKKKVGGGEGRNEKTF